MAPDKKTFVTTIETRGVVIKEDDYSKTVTADGEPIPAGIYRETTTRRLDWISTETPTVDQAPKAEAEPSA